MTAPRITIETDLPCKHGYVGRKHNIMQGAHVVAECIPGTEVRVLEPGEYMLKRPTRIIAETDIPCEHGVIGRNHNIMDGARVVAECIAATEVEIFHPSGVLLLDVAIDALAQEPT